MLYTLRITIKTLKNTNNLKENIKYLKKIGQFKNILIKGVYKKKNKNKIFTLLRSPHIYKKSREQFIYKNFIQKIDINFINFIELLNFIIILKKVLIKNFLINIIIIKNTYNLNGKVLDYESNK